MRTHEPRIPPLQPDEWTGEAGELIAPAIRKGRAPNLYATLARNPAAMRPFTAFVGYIRSCELPPREQEILILRIGWLSRSGYEWNAHTWLGRRVGLTDAEIERIKTGSTHADWPTQDAMLCRAAEELHADQFITDPTWDALSQRWSERQCMDLVFAASFYLVVACALNSFGVQFDPGAEPDPETGAWRAEEP